MVLGSSQNLLSVIRNCCTQNCSFIDSSLQHFRYLERDEFFQGADAGARNASVDILLFKGRSRTRCHTAKLFKSVEK